MKRKESATIECPFFKHYEAGVVACEGLVPNATLRLAFPSPTSRKEYMNDRCIKAHKECPLAQMLYKMYEG